MKIVARVLGSALPSDFGGHRYARLAHVATAPASR